jgi:type IV pilus assembly protein PilY1
MKAYQNLIGLLVAIVMASSLSTALAGTPSQLPLSLKSGVPPNIMFALSVEFPTAITPAYQDAANYSGNNSYLGYFDNTKCYYYNSTANSGSVTGWFYPFGYSTTVSGNASSCISGWSGNFLNWVSMAGLDEFRFAMTGGNRVVDLPNSLANPGGLTVLERSYQTAQGSNFLTKTFTEADGNTTPYPVGATLSIVSKGNGVGMVITGAGSTSGTATCNGPQLASPFNCSGNAGLGIAPYALSNGETTSCSGGYTGAGTLASPYKCSSFANTSSGNPVASPTAGNISQLVSPSTSGSVTLNCPSGSFSSSPPACTATLSNGETGSCSAITGAGTLGSPYTCSSFSVFSGGKLFAINTPGGASGSATTTGTVATPYTNTNVTCSVAGASPTTTCTSLDGNSTTASCSSYVTKVISSKTYYYCSTLANSSPDTFVSASTVGSSYTTISSKRYITNYTIVNNVNTTATFYYVPTYTGVYGTSVTYYYSDYAVSIGAGATSYNVRAKVCDPGIGVENNCKLYADNATYKPTGVLQDNGSAMRFGVTSYFNRNDIDNAVLRSKLKYLSPQQFLNAGSYTPNPVPEWSDTDGTFVNNPDSSDTATMTTPWGTAPSNSGVINYINKFGTASQTYKTYDDIGKLYYETLRYLRGGQGFGGKGPTTDFYNGATAATSDGFPVITTWNDPIQYSCQKNYIITMGDAHTWCDKRLPGGSYAANGNSVCNSYTDANAHAHGPDLGGLSGDTGIKGAINGSTITAANGVANATDAVGGMEGMGTISSTLTGAGSSASYYMAGLAAWAATNNIRPDKATSTSPMNVKTFVIDVQEGKDCSYQKQFWLAAKYGDPANYAINTTSGSLMWNSSSAWYNSLLGNSITCSSNSPPNYASSSLSMTWPKNLLRAGDPIGMINSVKSAIQSIAAQQGDEAALAQSSGSLNTGTGAYIYQATYNSGNWSGDVQAFVIDQQGNISLTADWSASQLLPAPSSRKILSFNRSTNSGINFAPDGSNLLSYFDTYQQGLLNTSDTGLSDGFGVDRVKYVKGDMSSEAYLPSTTGVTALNTLTNHGWRSRTPVGSTCNYTASPYTCSALASYTTGPTAQLADVIDSNPFYVGAPSATYPDTTYKTFAQLHALRKPMLYVGGNDGMLHGYNAAYYYGSTGIPTRCPKMSGGVPAASQPTECIGPSSTTLYAGTELFGYVPYASYTNLNQLMSPNYAHKYFVDGNVVTQDACISNGSGAAYCDGTNDKWMTVLVGGMNAGGKGVYALDVTDPVAGFSASNVLWDFSNFDDPDMGYTFSTPIIRKLNNQRWAVIFGNGFNSVNAVGNPNNNKAYLFILYLDPKLSVSQPWTLGTNYFKVELTSPTAVNNASNGLASVSSVDKNHDGLVDYIYAGDRNGNLWKVDLSSSTPSSWSSAFTNSAGTAAIPLFIAKDSAGHLQQITSAPRIANQPGGGYMVLFGTGSWIDATDPIPQSGSTFYTESIYGVWDKDNGAASSPATGRSVLQQQAIIGSYSVDSTGTACTAGTVNCTTYTIQSSCLPNYTTTPLIASNLSAPLCPSSIASPSGTGQQFGWYFDLPANGERSHSDVPYLTGSNVQITSLTPATNPCSGNTTGFEYNFDYLTGGNPTSPLFLIPGGGTSGYIMWTPPSGGAAIPIAPGGQSIVGGAAQNPVSFNATPPNSVVQAMDGMPTSMPAPCVTGSCTAAANTYIPGWGFLGNLSSGPTSTSGKWTLICYPQETGGTQKNCQWRHRVGQFGRLLWKQVN